MENKLDPCDGFCLSPSKFAVTLQRGDSLASTEREEQDYSRAAANKSLAIHRSSLFCASSTLTLSISPPRT